MNPIIYIAEPKDVAEVQEFYDRHGYRYNDLTRDVVVVAKQGSLIVGVGRLCEEQGTLILRGMQVLDGNQKCGVGRAILAKLSDAIGSRECFTLPWSHLETFYGSIGFKKIEVRAAPPHLKDRADEYYRQHANIIAMKRDENQ